MSALAFVRSWLERAHDQAEAGAWPVWRQALEAASLWATRGLGPNYYLAARFGRRHLSWRTKWRHMTPSEYRAVVDRLNPPAYRKASQHKVLEKGALSLLGLPTPAFVGYFHAQSGHDAHGQPLRSAAELQAALAEQAGQRLCFKLVEGYGGAGFLALDVCEGGRHLRHPETGDELEVDALAIELLRQPDGWLIERYLVQHADLAAFNPSSLNTLRLWVLDRGDGPQVTHALLRVGRQGSQVDNTSQGGLVVGVDVVTGRTQAVPDLRHPERLATHHPDHGGALAGRDLPHWPAVLALAVQALHAFPHMRFAGLDVAIGPDGPLLIEVNVQPDSIGALTFDLALKDYFEGL